MIIITITNFKGLKEHYDEVWAVVRSLRSNNGITQVQALSPSWDLFNQYRELRDNGNWNANTFKEIYVPQFLKEMHSKQAKDMLNELSWCDKQNYNICVVCFCKDEELCHRSIIGGLLQGVGRNVVGLKQDYSYYYKQWKEIGD